MNGGRRVQNIMFKKATNMMNMNKIEAIEDLNYSKRYKLFLKKEVYIRSENVFDKSGRMVVTGCGL